MLTLFCYINSTNFEIGVTKENPWKCHLFDNYLDSISYVTVSR